VQRACDHKKPEQFVIRDISFYAVKDVFRQINKEKHIEYLLYGIFEQGKDEK
jgi:hypothetical protein